MQPPDAPPIRHLRQRDACNCLYPSRVESNGEDNDAWSVSLPDGTAPHERVSRLAQMEAYSPAVALLAAQRDQRVDARGPTRRHVAREERDGRERDGHDPERERIGRPHAVEQA